MEITIVFEEGEEGFWVYSPDLPGCTSFGKTLTEARGSMKEAVKLHLEGMREDGDEIPAGIIVEKLAV